MKKIFKSKKMICHGHAEFKMPRNYVANDSYPMLGKEQAEERITAAYLQMDQVANDIRQGNKLTARHVFFLETMITLPFNPIWCKYKLTANAFYAENVCTGCGKCGRLCPLNNIKIIDKKPVWGNQCTHCMACIGNCPVKAIEYGTVTKDKEQYNFGKYSYVIKNLEKQDS